MKPPVALAAVAAAAAAALACQAIAAAPEGAAVDVRATMVEGVNPAALAIWDIGNAAIDDSGALDSAKMNAAGWDKLRDAALSLATHAHRLATAGAIRASGPQLLDGKVPEGVASREQIQAMIDANPGGFRALAGTMEEQANALATAAGERNAEKAGGLISGFDGTCEACHQNYWHLKP
jgi:hypothetical protein